jgi:hypothetical protein
MMDAGMAWLFDLLGSVGLAETPAKRSGPRKRRPSP